MCYAIGDEEPSGSLPDAFRLAIGSEKIRIPLRGRNGRQFPGVGQFRHPEVCRGVRHADLRPDVSADLDVTRSN